MKFDEYGQSHVTVEEMCNLLYANPNLDISKFYYTDPTAFNGSTKKLFAGYPRLEWYIPNTEDLPTFDARNQANWFMPQEYKDLDIAKWLLDQCKEDYEIQRIGQELLLYQERNLFDLLRFIKYMVDTFRQHNIVWGVGRGSSVASYALFLLGAHKIDSIYYDLDVTEFLR